MMSYRRLASAAFALTLTVSLQGTLRAQIYKDAHPYVYKAFKSLQEQSIRATMDARRVSQQIRSYKEVWQKLFGSRPFPTDSLDTLRSKMSARERQRAKEILIKWANGQRRAAEAMQRHPYYDERIRESAFRDQIRHFQYFGDLLERELTLINGQRVTKSLDPPPDNSPPQRPDPYASPEREAIASAIASTRDVARSLANAGKQSLPGGEQAERLLESTLPKLRRPRKLQLPDINRPFYNLPLSQSQSAIMTDEFEDPPEKRPELQPSPDSWTNQHGDLILDADTGFYSPSDSFEPSPARGDVPHPDIAASQNTHIGTQQESGPAGWLNSDERSQLGRDIESTRAKAPRYTQSSSQRRRESHQSPLDNEVRAFFAADERAKRERENDARTDRVGYFDDAQNAYNKTSCISGIALTGLTGAAAYGSLNPILARQAAVRTIATAYTCWTAWNGDDAETEHVAPPPPFDDIGHLPYGSNRER